LVTTSLTEKLLTHLAFNCYGYSYHSEMKHIYLKLNSSGYEFNY